MNLKNRILMLLKELASSISAYDSLEIDALKDIETALLQIRDRFQPPKPSAKQSDIVYIWSDGACKGNPGPGGWGAIIQIDGDRVEISGSHPQTTNNIMELTAALEGIRKTPVGSQVVLTTDSQYLVNGINQWISNWKRNSWKKSDGKPVLNQELWQRLDKESCARKIRWEWIKGHAGHPENERCDQLAKQAIELQSH